MGTTPARCPFFRVSGRPLSFPLTSSAPSFFPTAPAFLIIQRIQLVRAAFQAVTECVRRPPWLRFVFYAPAPSLSRPSRSRDPLSLVYRWHARGAVRFVPFGLLKRTEFSVSQRDVSRSAVSAIQEVDRKTVDVSVCCLFAVATVEHCELTGAAPVIVAIGVCGVRVLLFWVLCKVQEDGSTFDFRYRRSGGSMCKLPVGRTKRITDTCFISVRVAAILTAFTFEMCVTHVRYSVHVLRLELSRCRCVIVSYCFALPIAHRERFTLFTKKHLHGNVTFEFVGVSGQKRSGCLRHWGFVTEPRRLWLSGRSWSLADHQRSRE